MNLTDALTLIACVLLALSITAIEMARKRNRQARLATRDRHPSATHYTSDGICRRCGAEVNDRWAHNQEFHPPK